MATSRPASPIQYVATALVIAGGMLLPAGSVHAMPRQAPAGAPQFGDGSESYRGYRIEIAQDVANAEIGQLRRAAEHQVDIVEATSLNEGVKAFFRRFPVVVRAGSGAGSHYSGGESVTIAVENPNDQRPILLHEYIHVYHFRKLPGGRNNPDILTFYRRARAGGFYPNDAYLLQNQAEFFAMTASVYLHGKLAREPFTRDELRQKQPIYYKFLTRLLGPVGA
ncbi:hypothetical protein ABZT49_24435 [Methylobacterium sp. EM32]|uniref:hypothetical protein n=1 Tax=Methylobacterium sp. EM32 TaxID=3163481 RepID=UPI0033BED433